MTGVQSSPRAVIEFLMSVMDLFSTTSGTAPARAMAPAAMTVKMIEKRMVKRLEKAAEAGND